MNNMGRTIASALVFCTLSCGGCYSSSDNSMDAELPEEMQDSSSDEAVHEDERADGEGDGMEEEDTTYFCDMGILGGQIQLTSHRTGPGQNTAKKPMLAYTGSEFGIVWVDDRDTRPLSHAFFNRLSPTGERIADDMLLSGSDITQWPFITYSGSAGEFAIAWIYADGVTFAFYTYFSRVSSDGVKVGSDIVLSSGSVERTTLVLVATTFGYGLLWCDIPAGNCDLKFSRLGPQGEWLGDELMIDQDVQSNFHPHALVYSGSEFAAVWYDGDELGSSVYFERISVDGVPIGGPVTVTAEYPCVHPSMVFTGDEYALVCVSYEPVYPERSDIYLIRLSPEGERLAGDSKLTDGLARYEYPEPAFSGVEIGLLWVTYDEGQIFFGRFLPDGTRIGEVVQVADEVLTFEDDIRLVSTGSEYATAWQHENNIYFARIGCLP